MSLWDLEASTKWYVIGLGLGVNKDTLDAIQSDTGDSSHAACLRAMITSWLMQPDLRPTRSELERVLRSPEVGLAHLAEQLPSLTSGEKVIVLIDYCVAITLYLLEYNAQFCMYTLLPARPHNVLLLAVTFKTFFVIVTVGCGPTILHTYKVMYM